MPKTRAKGLGSWPREGAKTANAFSRVRTGWNARADETLLRERPTQLPHWASPQPLIVCGAEFLNSTSLNLRFFLRWF